MEDPHPAPEPRKWSRRRWVWLIVLGTVGSAIFWAMTAKPTVSFVRFTDIGGVRHLVFRLRSSPFRTFTYYTDSSGAFGSTPESSPAGSAPLVTWHLYVPGNEYGQMIGGVTRELRPGEVVEFRVPLAAEDPDGTAYRIGVTFTSPNPAPDLPFSVREWLPDGWLERDWTIWSDVVTP